MKSAGKEGIVQSRLQMFHMDDEILLNAFSALAQEESQSISMNQRSSIGPVKIYAQIYLQAPAE